MRYRLELTSLLLATISTVGCANSQLRPFKWWRVRSTPFQVAQTLEPVEHQTSIESLSASPPKLPPGIELPPASKSESKTLSSGATQPPESSSNGVIFAGAFGSRHP